MANYRGRLVDIRASPRRPFAWAHALNPIPQLTSRGKAKDARRQRGGGREVPDELISRSGGLIGRHGAIVVFAAVAAIIPALIGGGDSPGTGSVQVVDSAWMRPAVWNGDGARDVFAYPEGYLRDWTHELIEHEEPPQETEDSMPEARLVALFDEVEEPTPVPTPTPEPWSTMEVRAGDTLFDLSLWFGLKPGDIASVNGIGPGEPIVIGETIVIPIPQSEFVAPPEPTVVFAVEEEPAAEPASEPETVTPPPPPPPPPETPAPTPQATPPPFSGTTDEVVEAICSQPWDCETMVQVAMCESGLYPGAVNPAGYWGLFQINYQFEGWDDPWINSQVAYEQKYLPAQQHGGTGLEPWPICGQL